MVKLRIRSPEASSTRQLFMFIAVQRQGSSTTLGHFLNFNPELHLHVHNLYNSTHQSLIVAAITPSKRKSNSFSPSQFHQTQDSPSPTGPSQHRPKQLSPPQTQKSFPPLGSEMSFSATTSPSLFTVESVPVTKAKGSNVYIVRPTAIWNKITVFRECNGGHLPFPPHLRFHHTEQILQSTLQPSPSTTTSPSPGPAMQDYGPHASSKSAAATPTMSISAYTGTTNLHSCLSIYATKCSQVKRTRISPPATIASISRVTTWPSSTPAL